MRNKKNIKRLTKKKLTKNKKNIASKVTIKRIEKSKKYHEKFHEKQKE